MAVVMVIGAWLSLAGLCAFVVGVTLRRVEATEGAAGAVVELPGSDIRLLWGGDCDEQVAPRVWSGSDTLVDGLRSPLLDLPRRAVH